MDLSIFKDPKRAQELLKLIHQTAGDEHYSLMEVCGTHTVSIARYGFRSLMPQGVQLLSGPGCPVCVTADEDIDYAIDLADLEDVILTSFGDMLRVPGSQSSLYEKKAQGKDIRICYSPLDALNIARENPDKEVVFIGVGFETTAPIIGAALLQAQEEELKNFSVFSAHKTMPGALDAIVNDPEIKIDGLILPGHVSTIIGKQPYQFLATDYGMPGVITGFEPVDVLQGILKLIQMVQQHEAAICNAYPRAVKDEGNLAAQAIIHKFFEPCDVQWRGLGIIAQSGLRLKDCYAQFDARQRFKLEQRSSHSSSPCKCGDVLRGAITPQQCPIFGRTCNPQHPVGPCMVSSEGSCAAYYRYQEHSRV